MHIYFRTDIISDIAQTFFAFVSWKNFTPTDSKKFLLFPEFLIVGSGESSLWSVNGNDLLIDNTSAIEHSHRLAGDSYEVCLMTLFIQAS